MPALDPAILSIPAGIQANLQRRLPQAFLHGGKAAGWLIKDLKSGIINEVRSGREGLILTVECRLQKTVWLVDLCFDTNWKIWKMSSAAESEMQLASPVSAPLRGKIRSGKTGRVIGRILLPALVIVISSAVFPFVSPGMKDQAGRGDQADQANQIEDSDQVKTALQQAADQRIKEQDNKDVRNVSADEDVIVISRSELATKLQEEREKGVRQGLESVAVGQQQVVQPNSDAVIVYHLEPGISSEKVVVQLFELGVFPDPNQLNRELIRAGMEKNLRAGTYYLRSNMKVEEIIRLLDNGQRR